MGVLIDGVWRDEELPQEVGRAYQSVEFFDALYINRPRIILALQDNHHLVLADLLPNQHINLAFLPAVPTIQFCVVNHLGIRRELLLNLRHQNFQVFSVRSHAPPSFDRKKRAAQCRHSGKRLCVLVRGRVSAPQRLLGRRQLGAVIGVREQVPVAVRGHLDRGVPEAD